MNNKKITIMFIVIATIALLGIVGFTMAYFTSSTDFENEFSTGFYQTEATEVFTSPSNWLPGDETPKTLTITNTGDVDVKARVCITENWESDNGDTLPIKQNKESVAIINLDNTDDWTKRGKCYYYNEILSPNEETSSFIESVTFNPNIEANIECSTATSNGTKTKICESQGDWYDNATYTLTLTVETVQANAASELWKPVQFVYRQLEGQITTGDEIAIGTEHFYVVSSNRNMTVLLAKYNLLVGDIYDYDTNANPQYSLDKTLSESDTGYGLQNSIALGSPIEINGSTTQIIGVVGFSGTNYWDDSVCGYTGTNFGCTGTEGLLSEYSQSGEHYNSQPYPYVYRSNIGNEVEPQVIFKNGMGYNQNNGYSISYFVEEYTNVLKDLGAPNSIVGRLLTYDEARNLGCSMDWCSSNPVSNGYYPGSAPDWTFSTNYWLGSVYSSQETWYINNNGEINYQEYDYSYNKGVRPVIEIPPSELN